MSLFSKRKKLLAVGCSYTDEWWTREYGFPVWPELLAEKLDMDCHNLGQSGAGNTHISGKLFDTIVEEKFDLVVIQWSEFQRMDFQDFFRPPGQDKFQIWWRHLHPHRITSYEAFKLDPEEKNKLLKYNSIIASTLAVLRLFWITQNILKDMPYLMIQGCTPVGTPHLGPLSVFGQPDDYYNIIVKECIRFMLKSSYVDLIEGKKFIGWPLWQQLGGFSIDDHLDKLDPEQEKYRVSEEDTHPNYAGHKIISELIYEEYKKVYL